MNYRRLGRAGIKVSSLCLGAGVRGALDPQRFRRTIAHTIDLGCNFIDCANNYGGGQVECANAWQRAPLAVNQRPQRCI